MEPVESVQAREEAYAEVIKKCQRYAHSARLDEFDYLDSNPPVRHG
jgi:hypothetical protein